MNGAFRAQLNAVMIGGFASMASARLCDSMLPRLSSDFGGSVSSVSKVVSIFALAYGLSQLFYGPLADRFGKLRVIFYATLAASLGALACALSRDLASLSAARFFAGLTAAGIIPLAIAWIGDSVPYEQRQAVMARLLVGTVSGLIIGPLVGGIASDTIGWRAAFWLIAAMYLFCAARLGRHALQSMPPARSQDRGSVWATYLSVLREPQALFVLPAVTIEGMLVFAVLAFVPSFIHQRESVTLFSASLAIASFGIGGLVYAWRSQSWLKRLGEQGFSRWGASLFGVGVLMLALLPGLTGAYLGCFAAGLGFYMLHNTLQTLGSQIAPAVRGSAMSLFAFLLFAGQTLGVMASALVVASLGYLPVFIIAALGVSALGWWIAQRLRRQGAMGS